MQPATTSLVEFGLATAGASTLTFCQEMTLQPTKHPFTWQLFLRCVSLSIVATLASTNPTLGNDMPPESFTQYAQSKELNLDQTFTVELLIEEARREFDPNYWDHWEERSDAREEAGYIPSFLDEHIEPTWGELKQLEWLSLQRVRGRQRPLRDLSAVQYLTKLTGLVIIDNEVSDVSHVGALVNLKRLHLAHNPIKSLSPLSTCLKIEELDIRGVSAGDLSVLESLPKLRELKISINQVTALERIDKLPALKHLNIGIGDIDSFASFENFPQMPELQEIRGADVNSLKGLERFPKLKKLINLSGGFDSLEPLANSKALTHANILGSRVRSVEPLSTLVSLRDLWLNTDAPTLDLSPLESLPALRELTVKCNGEELAGLDKFRATLGSWDIEFRAPKPRYTASLELEIVDQKTFDVYDTEKPYNVTKSDGNEELLSSELEWLDEQIDDVLSADFEEDEDYTIPHQWGGARSRTVALLSEEAIEAFPRLVLGIQKVLSTAKKDWIIYFQSDGEEFIVWVYPDKIMVTKEYAETVRKLIKQK